MKKKIITFIVVVVIIFGVIAAGLWGYKYYQSENSTVEVISVYDISWGSWDDGSANSYGIVVNESVQEIYLSSDSSINQIYVNVGDWVEEGDPLLLYDIDSISGEIEQKKLDIDSILNEIAVENYKLSILKNSTPVDKTEPQIDEEKLAELEAQDEENNSMPETTEKNSKIYNYLTDSSVPSNAIVDKKTNKITYPFGTEEDPYIYYCTEKAFAYGSFYNSIRGTDKESGKYVEIYIKNEEGKKKIIDGNLLPTVYDEDRMWYIFSGKERFYSALAEEYQTEFDEEYSNWEEPEGYTQEELIEEIADAEATIKNLDVEYRKMLLQLTALERAALDGMVYATVSGEVKTLGDPNDVSEDTPFLVVMGDGDLYVKGVINELLLEHADIGTVINVIAWESGMTYEATVTEIDDMPTTGNYLGEGNPNVSYYEFSVCLEKEADLNNGEYVDLVIDENKINENSIYIEKAYVREENGQHYCMIADENGKLKKQYVVTGKTLYGSAIEIKSGITEDDYIAFPYGKEVVEGATVIESIEY